MKNLRKYSHQNGDVFIETALIMPLLFLIIFGGYVSAIGVETYLRISSIAYEAVRFTSKTPFIGVGTYTTNGFLEVEDGKTGNYINHNLIHGTVQKLVNNDLDNSYLNKNHVSVKSELIEEIVESKYIAKVTIECKVRLIGNWELPISKSVTSIYTQRVSTI
jgi:hypothetical protein